MTTQRHHSKGEIFSSQLSALRSWFFSSLSSWKKEDLKSLSRTSRRMFKMWSVGGWKEVHALCQLLSHMLSFLLIAKKKKGNLQRGEFFTLVMKSVLLKKWKPVRHFCALNWTAKKLRNQIMHWFLLVSWMLASGITNQYDLPSLVLIAEQLSFFEGGGGEVN